MPSPTVTSYTPLPVLSSAEHEKKTHWLVEMGEPPSHLCVVFIGGIDGT